MVFFKNVSAPVAAVRLYEGRQAAFIEKAFP